MAIGICRLYRAFLILLSGLPIFLADEVESNVFLYDSQTFATEISKKNTFVMFFAPWCGHCKRLAPIWDEFGEKYNKLEEKLIIIAKVDCTTDTELCSKEGVSGYPTLKFFSAGKTEGIRYKGSRDIAGFESFVKEQLGLGKEEADSVKTVSEPSKGLVELTDTTFAKHVEYGLHFVKFYAPWCGYCQKLAPTWESLAKSLENDYTISIAKVDCVAYKSVCSQFEIKGYPTLLWIQDGKAVEKYDGGRSHEELKAYVSSMMEKDEREGDSETLKIPEEPPAPVIIMTGGNFKQAIGSGYSFVKFFAPWCGHCQRLAPLWEDLARKCIGKEEIKIGKVDCTQEEAKPICKEQEIDAYPTMLFYKDGIKVQEYTGSRDLESMYSFVMNHLRHEEL